jgi:hypothetical protein
VEGPHGQQVPAISGNDMGGARNLGAFQDLVVIRIGDHGLEHPWNRHHAKKGHEIGKGFDDLFRRE